MGKDNSGALGYFVAVGLVVAVVLGITALGARAIERDTARCEDRGGTHVQTRHGYACLRAEHIALPPLR